MKPFANSATQINDSQEPAASGNYRYSDNSARYAPGFPSQNSTAQRLTDAPHYGNAQKVVPASQIEGFHGYQSNAATRNRPRR